MKTNELKILRREYIGSAIFPINDTLFIKASNNSDRALLKVVYRKEGQNADLESLTEKERAFMDDPQIQKCYWNIVFIFRKGAMTFNHPWE